MNTKMNLEEKVQQWFVDRNLHEANPVKQFLKLMEESGELFEGIAKDKSELIYDALGDIQVVLIGLDQQIKNGAQISANQQELELLLMVSSLGNIAQKLYAHVCHNETQIPLIKADLMFLAAGLNIWQSIHIKKLEAKRPIVVYKADNQGAEIKGRVLQKEKIGDMYTITVQNYGIFVVTKTSYESLKIGDEVIL